MGDLPWPWQPPMGASPVPNLAHSSARLLLPRRSARRSNGMTFSFMARRRVWFATFHSGYAIAIYIAACAVVSLVSTALMPDYTGQDISTEYDDLSLARVA